MQITSVDQDGRNFLGTVVSKPEIPHHPSIMLMRNTYKGPGDLWYFPPGIPHTLQATNISEGGAEFLLARYLLTLSRRVADNQYLFIDL